MTAHDQAAGVNMQAPLCLTFRQVEFSSALAARVSELADRLERVHDRIIRCDVVIAGPAHRCNGGAFDVSVEITIPGGVINARSDQSARPEHASAFVALDITFATVSKQLQDDAQMHYGRKRASAPDRAAS